MNKILRLTVFFILLAAFISFHWIKFKSDKFIFNSFVDGGDLVFSIFENEEYVFGYEVNSLEVLDKGHEYKAIYEVKNLNKELNQIKILNFKEKNILPNHAYYLSFSYSGGKGEPGVVLKSINFCIKNKKVINSGDMDNDSFISDCHE